MEVFGKGFIDVNILQDSSGMYLGVIDTHVHVNGAFKINYIITAFLCSF